MLRVFYLVSFSEGSGYPSRFNVKVLIMMTISRYVADPGQFLLIIKISNNRGHDNTYCTPGRVCDPQIDIRQCVTRTKYS